jgi:catechol 2,3-dioxygenase-like lactoylglutathione lyase family enzyme
MAQASVGHLVYYVKPENLDFYKTLFAQCGWTSGHQEATFAGMNAPDGSGVGVWFMGFAKPVANDYDGPGLNHLALHTRSIADVDEITAWLAARGVTALFETPRHRPDFSPPDGTYYQVMFESPDRILFEIVYIGSA